MKKIYEISETKKDGTIYLFFSEIEDKKEIFDKLNRKQNVYFKLKNRYFIAKEKQLNDTTANCCHKCFFGSTKYDCNFFCISIFCDFYFEEIPEYQALFGGNNEQSIRNK